MLTQLSDSRVVIIENSCLNGGDRQSESFQDRFSTAKKSCLESDRAAALDVSGRVPTSRNTSTKKSLKGVSYPIDEILQQRAANNEGEREEEPNKADSDMTSFAKFIESLNHQREMDDPAFVLQPSMDEKTLPANYHYLPTIRRDRRYTLVLDLDETLIHFEEKHGGKGKVLVRPYASYFLEKVSAYYEVVIFTAALQEYADEILDNLDTSGCITHRLYRDHTLYYNNIHHKDLSALGRPLSHTIIVDNCVESFRLQPNNGIYIRSWYNDRGDEALLKLCPLLIDMVHRSVPDVRTALRDLKLQNSTKSKTNTK